MEELDIYKFKPDELRELTFTELKVLAVLRQLAKEKKIDYSAVDEKLEIKKKESMDFLKGIIKWFQL